VNDEAQSRRFFRQPSTAFGDADLSQNFQTSSTQRLNNKRSSLDTHNSLIPDASSLPARIVEIQVDALFEGGHSMKERVAKDCPPKTASAQISRREGLKLTAASAMASLLPAYAPGGAN
jgi:hypothetical protein